MALVSPGVQVTVTDQSNYAPNALGSVAFILLATAQDKPAPGGVGIAAGTTAENAEKIWTITSQRELITTFGTPIFKTTSAGTASNANEQNEYGLLAAYSLLGVSNTVYVQRANVDLGGLTGTTVRPLKDPANGTYWLDTADTNWGIYEWNYSTKAFNFKTPIVITSSSDLVANVTPNVSIGAIGDYAVNAYDDMNQVYYKIYDNSWQAVGSNGWQMGWPTITGSVTSPTITANASLVINNVTIPLFIGNTAAQVAAKINAQTAIDLYGVTARVSNNQLIISGNSAATTSGFDDLADGNIDISYSNTTILNDLGLTSGVYSVPQLSIAPYYSVPTWEGNIYTASGKPTGSVWQKASVTGSGLSMAVKKFNTTTGQWVSLSVPDYANVFAATYTLDPTGGGVNVPTGSVFAQYDANGDNTIAQYLWERKGSYPTTVVGVDTTPSAPGVGASFTVTTRANVQVETTSTYTVTVTTGTVNGFISAVSAANIPYITATLDTSGAMKLVHSLGGDFVLKDGAQTPLANVGITMAATNVYEDPTDATQLIATNWEPLSVESYTASSSQPYAAPNDNTYWYYNTPSRVDIMVSNGSAWVGYRTLTSDIRGYNLTATNTNGTIISSSEPTAQDDGSDLVYGDLWLNTSALDSYPKLYRWQSVSGVDQWVLIDNTDNTGQNGIVFADARWSTNGDVNPVTGTIPTIAELALSNYVDLDAPDPGFYPRGMLLWNTRASGYNVKQYKSNYFTAAAYPNETLPGREDTWVTVSGYDNNNVPNFGSNAQRGVVVAALKAAIDSSTTIREDANVFNLISCPGYPELIPNMVVLNEDRNNTSFIIGDTPMKLPATGTAIQAWATNSAGATSTGNSGLVTVNPYVGIYYPSGQTNDLSGNSVAVPPSHAVLRVMVKSDNFSYPWIAPAGTRRGLIDNLNAIGYVDANSGKFVSIGVTQGLRDVMYINKINPLTYLPGSGLVVYGQKTLSAEPSALDRVNVARLTNYLRTQLNVLARPFVFEPNDPITRNGISAVTSSLLNDLVAKRGITDYLVVCDTTNNTPERIARNELYVDVAVQPTKAVEFIFIPIRLKNPGEIQSGNFASAQTVGTGA